MERRQNSGQRCKIVQDAIRDLMDEIERIVCYLYIRNFDDHEVMKELHIDRKRLKEIKTGIRRKLVEAGIKD